MTQRQKMLAGVLLCLAVVTYVTYSIITNAEDTPPGESPRITESAAGETLPNEEGESGTDKKSAANASYFVYVTGAIENPGVYHLDHAMTMKDVIQACGGFLPYADTDSVNLAEEVPAGTRIHVPFRFTGNPEDLLRKTKININTADEKELTSISGIGPATAKRILDYRKEKGNFTTIQDIKKVKGIGNGTFKKMQSLITV